MFPNWLQPTLPREVLQERYLKISFSQNGEDDFIRSYFWDRILQGFKGIYLDIGCYDETLYSNTKLLSLIGWSGLAVDANPDLKEPWLVARPGDKFINVCISPAGTSYAGLEFFRFRDGAMSTANKERARQLVSEGWDFIDNVRVPALSLLDLARRSTELGFKRPNLVSLDLEMVDYLDDLPSFLNLLQPELLCIEPLETGINLRSIFNSKEYRRLSAANYEPISIIGGNIFAVPSKLAN
jgi:hypothetical protein